MEVGQHEVRYTKAETWFYEEASVPATWSDEATVLRRRFQHPQRGCAHRDDAASIFTAFVDNARGLGLNLVPFRVHLMILDLFSLHR